MSRHSCDWSSGYCGGCDEQSHNEAVRSVLSMRGRWLVVYEGGSAVRRSRRSEARGEVRTAQELGIRARMIRYRRDRVDFNEDVPQLEVNDERWLP